MLFHSYEFALFFLLTAALFGVVPPRQRPLLLLAASYLFYMAWNPAFLSLILFSTVLDFVAARRIERADTPRTRKRWLALSLCGNLGLLFVFKYLSFAFASAAQIVHWAGGTLDLPELDILLPVGISFYTFQTIAYTIEVYCGRQSAIQNPLHLALYVSFFPQLVAGPIERPQRLLPQLAAPAPAAYPDRIQGLRLALWGLTKKVLIADRLAVVVDAVYDDPSRFPGSILVLATVFFAFQIYCDFSGYSDMAIGIARVFGVDLMRNFNRPYVARSLPDFWRRWHISLSTWFRDYVYIPLGGNRGTRARWVAAIAAVFLLSGLWHGANWTFVAWGAAHAGCFLIWQAVDARRSSSGNSARGIVSLAITFAVVCVTWVFFRAQSLGDAAHILAHAHRGWLDVAAYGGYTRLLGALDVSAFALGLDAVLIAFLLTVEAWCGEHAIEERLDSLARPLRWTAYLALCLAMMNYGVTHEMPFVYFQF